MILAVSVTLVACNQVDATEIRTRWERNGEMHVFNITLADFAGEGTGFRTYNADGDPVNGGAYFKDIAFGGEFGRWDEIRPVDVVGTYTLRIQLTSDKSSFDVTTKQVMYVKYNLKPASEGGVDFDKYSELRNAEPKDSTEYEALGLTKTEGTTILKSTTETAVRFENKTSQKPESSSTIVDGFYVGKANQSLTKYSVSTEYNYDNKRPVAKIKMNDGEPTEYKFGKNTAGRFIDSNQILMYLRSLDKSSKGFQDSPSISVFNPYTQELQTASFAPTYENGAKKLLRNVVLTDTSRENNAFATGLNVVAVSVGNNSFMMQENLPDTLAAKGLDRYYIENDPEPKFTTVRFRVGYLAYEINYAHAENTTNWSEIFTALATKEEG